MKSVTNARLLYELASLYGVQIAYYDVFNRRHQASVEALLAVLQSLGASVVTLSDVPSALRERQQALWQQPLEPVSIAWGGKIPAIQVRLPVTTADANLQGRLIFETGEEKVQEWHCSDLPGLTEAVIEGVHYVVKRLPLSGKLPWGYHRFTLDLLGRNEESLIISAPHKAYMAPEHEGKHIWGVFLPLYAWHTQRSWGCGDLSDLQSLMTWVASKGGQIVATLPVLPIFLDDIFEPSPYLPISRLLWNEFYLDISKVPEMARCPSVKDLMASTSFQEEIEDLRRLPLIDYHRQMALKRQILKELSLCCFSDGSDRCEALLRFGEDNPVIEDYAQFRATCEKRRAPWRLWPQPLKKGMLKEGDYDEETKRYYVYVQWLAYQQMQDLFDKAHSIGQRLFFDFPLGAHPDGYDVWRERNAFVMDISVGAPPDAVFTRGQNWGFPPLHPGRNRQQGYRYLIKCLRHHLQCVDILRIDHVMGLHRLYWIPKGLEASQGVYVCYNPEELYAILALESHRNKSIIIGEDLGTVPPEVRPAMSKHGLSRMYVIYHELASKPQESLAKILPNSVVSLNTHDMPPFASFWQGMDIKERLELGILDKAGLQKEKRNRRAIKKILLNFLREKGWIDKTVTDLESVLNACLAFLSASPARITLINLEDIWLETKSQNIPSTKQEYPNWRHRARYSLEALDQVSQLIDSLRLIDHFRKQVVNNNDTRKRN